MDIGSGKGYPEGALSNFSPHPFEFGGVQIASMEGFLQSLKFKDVPMQDYVCTLVGFKAKKKGAKKNWQESQTLWWRGNPIPRDSDEYQQLLDDAFKAMFTQNSKAKNALLASGNAVLKHSIGRTKRAETVLTIQEFCSRLTKLRTHIKFVESLESADEKA